MTPSRHVTVRIDLARIRSNTQSIAQQTSVPIIAVVKADAYGLGAAAVVPAIADLVAGFYVFDLAEALAANLAATGKPTIAMQAGAADAAAFLAANVRPVVWDA